MLKTKFIAAKHKLKLGICIREGKLVETRTEKAQSAPISVGIVDGIPQIMTLVTEWTNNKEIIAQVTSKS